MLYSNICEAREGINDSEVIEETFRTAQSSCAPRSGETRPQSPEPNICTYDLGLREEEYVHTWDREAYLRAIATEPRWMEVLDRLCADQI